MPVWPSSRKLRARDCPRHQSRSAVPFFATAGRVQKIRHSHRTARHFAYVACMQGMPSRASPQAPASSRPQQGWMSARPPWRRPYFFACLAPQGQPTRGSWRSPLHDGRGDVCLIDCTNGTLGRGPRPWSEQRSRQHLLGEGKAGDKTYPCEGRGNALCTQVRPSIELVGTMV